MVEDGGGRRQYQARRARRASGLPSKAEACSVGRGIDALMARYPNASVNADEQRLLRAALYRPLLNLPKSERTRIVDAIIAVVLR